MLGLDVRKRSRVFALSPARSGTRVGSEIAFVKSLRVPLAILWPQKGPRSCELREAPVANWHNRQPGIIHQLMRRPPKALPMGLGL